MTNLEKLTLTIASGHANTCSSRNVSRATWTYLTSRGGVLAGSLIHRRPHHDHLHDTTTSVGALVTRVITPVGPGKDTHGTLGRYDRRLWVAQPPAQRAKRLTMPHHKNTTNERCSDKQGSERLFFEMSLMLNARLFACTFVVIKVCEKECAAVSERTQA